MDVDPAPEPAVTAPKSRSKKGKEKAAPPPPPAKEKPRATTKEPEAVQKDEVKTEAAAAGVEDEPVEIDGGPPLGYARAVSRPSKRPERAFCEICGYWGNYRCGKCGARYCDLACMGTHQEMACGKLFR